MTDRTAAQAAQQNNRTGDGKYATKVQDEAVGVDITPKTESDISKWYSALRIPSDFDTAGRLRYVGMVVECRRMLNVAAIDAARLHGDEAYSIEYLEDDGVFSTFTVRSAPDANGQARTLGSVDVEGVFFDNGTDDLITDEQDQFSVAAAKDIDLEKDATHLTGELAGEHMRTQYYDHIAMGEDDIDWAVENIISVGDLEDIETVNDLSDEQWEKLTAAVRDEYEIPDSAMTRINEHFSELVEEKLREALGR